jgi:hypothetical protein
VVPGRNGNSKTNPESLSTKGKAKPTSKPANEVITDSELVTDLNPSQPDEVGALSSVPVASPSAELAHRNRLASTGGGGVKQLNPGRSFPLAAFEAITEDISTVIHDPCVLRVPLPCRRISSLTTGKEFRR